jgi:hypothetical protein
MNRIEPYGKPTLIFPPQYSIGTRITTMRFIRFKRFIRFSKRKW